MGISMNSATYARDDAGLRKLKSEFSSDMTRTFLYKLMVVFYFVFFHF